MSRYIPFSKRRKIAEQATPVYRYDIIPETLRRQIILILRQALGTVVSYHNYLDQEMYGDPHSLRYWDYICQNRLLELGEFKLSKDGIDPVSQVCMYFMESDVDGFLDTLELSLILVDKAARMLDDGQRHGSRITLNPDDAIEEINYRFQENCIGYSYVLEAEKIIRIDSQYLHEEAVQRAFTLLNWGRK